ncbi:hypothetical protein BKA83DRAFT_4277437 [Pisolithus microcarpus]|nr:hypothetical protein BKA83DRAFT_4277437 [Pisolithus microcarpus]
MHEMLKPTSLIMGAGLGKDIACLRDGRFSRGNVISVDTVSNTIELHITPEEMEC